MTVIFDAKLNFIFKIFPDIFLKINRKLRLTPDTPNNLAHCSYLDNSISTKFIEKNAWFSRLDPGSVKPLTIMFLTNEYKIKMLGD